MQERRSYRLEFSRQEFLLLIEAQALFEQRNLKLVTLNALTKGVLRAHDLYRQSELDLEALETTRLVEEQIYGTEASAQLVAASMTLFGSDVAAFAKVKSELTASGGNAVSVKAALIYLCAAYINHFGSEA